MNQKICGYELDEQQKQIVLDQSNHLLVVAGAGSGKTLTILGKLYYLIEVEKINPEEIICISFTKAASDSLREKIKKEFNYDISVYTFHKLALQVLKQDKQYQITDINTLENIIDHFFRVDIFKYPKLLKKICRYLKIKQSDYEREYANLEPIKLLLSTFIRLFKCNNHTLNNFLDFFKISKRFNFRYHKEKDFLLLALNIYLLYQKYLEDNDEIDFDDMLIKATDYVNHYGYKKTVKYIIIDEYQDTSFVRFNFIKNILDKTNSKLMVVGDDFQSIYRFTGCDLSLFLDFKNYFHDAKIMKIENTYRNSQQLIKIAGSFVMKNKKQIKKNLHSNKQLDNPIVIAYFNEIKKDFIKLVLKLYRETKKSILVLGRNNNDIHYVIDKKNFKMYENKLVYLEDKNIELYYLTVHKSKGLEEENVIIINLRDAMIGFPNQIKNEKILRYVSPSVSKYPYDEERRLFYVALTRTKNRVYLFTKKGDESTFVKELLKDYKSKIFKYMI